MTKPLDITLSGTVKEIINPSDPSAPQEAQIAIEGPDAPVGELRIVNTLTKKNGQEVTLKEGASVEITIKA
jgi:hypothetical protein